MEEKYTDENVLDLREIFGVLMARKWFIICAAVFGFVFAFCYTKICIPYQFTSSVSMYVKNATNKNAADIVNQSDITAAQQLAATYIEILSDDVVADMVGEKLLENYTVEELMPYFGIEEIDGNYKIETSSIAGRLRYSTVNETELIKVSATCGNPVIAADMCNYITEIAPEVLIRVVGAGDVEAIGEARVSNGPSAPSAKKNAVLGFLIGIIFSCGIVLIKFLCNNTVKSGYDAAAKFNLPLIGEVPYYEFGEESSKNLNKSIFGKFKSEKNENTSNKERKTILDAKVPFMVQEAYNTMRNNMMFSLSTEKNNVFIISSPLPSEGKSTTTANLSIALGETDIKVLLVDSDLRKPVQHKMFNLSNKKGLSSVLAGICSFDKAVNRGVHQNMDVLTAGPVPPNPSQLLASENMYEFINEVKYQYDYVVIDTSPINMVSDALVIAKNTAGLIMVARQDATTYDQIERAILSSRILNVNILGIVVNLFDSDTAKYGKYGKYSYKYNYNYNYGKDVTYKN